MVRPQMAPLTASAPQYFENTFEDIHVPQIYGNSPADKNGYGMRSRSGIYSSNVTIESRNHPLRSLQHLVINLQRRLVIHDTNTFADQRNLAGQRSFSIKIAYACSCLRASNCPSLETATCLGPAPLAAEALWAS
jgi:hypothetical protein